MPVWRHLLKRVDPFGGLYNEASELAVIGCPLEATVSFKPGTRFAPRKIRVAAEDIEFYSIYGDIDVEEIGFHDLGDVFTPAGLLEESLRNIAMVYRGFIEEYRYKTPICLGGEHTVTLPIITSLCDKIETLVVFDAHFDLRDDYLGNKLSHACVMRRIMEKCGHIHILYIGVRAFTGDEKKYADESRRVVYYKITELGDKIDSIGDTVSGTDVYVSIDMDVFDPGYAPGVGNPEPNGLSPALFFKLYTEIISSAKNIIGVDIVETNPLVDINDITSLLAARIVVETAGILTRMRSS